MGCFLSKNINNVYQEDMTSLEIEKQIKKEKQIILSEIKILLLGTGESGKSTILKQMKIIHDGGFSQLEVDLFKKVVYANLVESMQKMIDYSGILTYLNNNGKENDSEDSETVAEPQIKCDIEQYLLDKAKLIMNTNLTNQVNYNANESRHTLTDDHFDALLCLWKSDFIQEACRLGDSYNLQNSSLYFFESINRIKSKNYIPSNEDILKARVKTIGINETKFKENTFIFRIIDVGGQRSERKKWIHCFENVTSILFLASLSEYDQFLEEDSSTNRMHEALNLFQTIINMNWFRNTHIILFLNKVDLFKEKLLKNKNLTEYFPDSKSCNNNFEKCANYFKNRFESLNQSKPNNTTNNGGKIIYTHFTTATDTRNIEFVMCAVKDMLMQDNLRQCGLL